MQTKGAMLGSHKEKRHENFKMKLEEFISISSK
jgi:hypothetical protein